MDRKLSRRNFMMSAAAGATWLGASPARAAIGRASRERFGGYAMGIQSYSLRHFDTIGVLDRAKELGLEYIEFWGRHYDPTLDKDAIARHDREMAKRGLAISAHGVQPFGADHAANERFFWFARMAGVRVITAGPAPDSFESLDRLVKQFNTRIAIHNHGPGSPYDTPEDCLKAAEPWDKRIGYCVDTGNFIRSGVDPVEATRKLGHRLYGVHLKDYVGAGADAQETIHGEGVMDLVAFFKTVNEIGFPHDGAFSVEYESNPEDPMDDIRKSLENAAIAARKAAG